jgi:S-DNA-T family DNA segregation ATPase FtsK/SpoIIIE
MRQAVAPFRLGGAPDDDRGYGTVKEFIRRRLIEAAGATLFVASILLMLVLITYDPRDPSFNVATSRVPANFGGPQGAMLADALVQAVGQASLILPVIFAIWALRLMLRLPVPTVWLRLAILPLLLVVAAFSLGALPGAPGGVVGHLFWISPRPAEIGLPLAIGAAILAGLIFAFVLGLSRGEGHGRGRPGLGQSRCRDIARRPRQARR